MMRQETPLSSLPCAPSPQNIFYRFGWLLVGCCVLPLSRSHQNPRPRRSLYFQFFWTLKSPPKMTSKHPPHTFLPSRVSSPMPPLPPTPSFCWVLCRPTSGGYLRPVLRPSLNFLVGAILVPQTQEPVTSRANLGAGPCARLIGSRGAAPERATESHGRQKRQWWTSPWLAYFVFVVCE